MTPFPLEARARVFGDNINTDYIVTSRRKRESLDPQVLRHYLFEELDPAFAATIKPGDLIVAGRNFGCGSAMEVAATAIIGAGIRAVLARSFSRTYYRNAINNGLMPIVCDTSGIAEGDRLLIDDSAEALLIRNLTAGVPIQATPLPQIALSILEVGGLVQYIRQHGGFRLP